MTVAGLLLAAGAGTRMGTPKALLRDAAGVPFLDRTLGYLFEGGCDTVTVVLGAAAGEARELLAAAGWDEDLAVSVVEAADWATGMGASLRAGLASLADSGTVAALVTLVDLPDVTDEVVRRLLAGPSAPSAPSAPAHWPGRRTTGTAVTRSCSAGSTGPAWWRRQPATGARGTTSRRTRCEPWSVATSPPVATSTTPPTSEP